MAEVVHIDHNRQPNFLQNFSEFSEHCNSKIPYLVTFTYLAYDISKHFSHFLTKTVEMHYKKSTIGTKLYKIKFDGEK